MSIWLVKALSCIVEGDQNDSKNQSKMPVCAHLGQQSNRQLTGFDLYSLPLKFSWSKSVNYEKVLIYNYMYM